MSEDIIYRPSHIYAIWELIRLVNTYGDGEVSPESAVKAIQQSGLFGGSIPVKPSLILAQQHGLLDIRSQKLFLTDVCKSHVIVHSTGSELNLAISRAIIGVIVKQNLYSWLAFFDGDVPMFRSILPTDWVDILEAADLLNIADEIVVNWWQEILEALETYDISNQKKIGDLGEKLSFDFERQRLSQAGVVDILMRIRWMSRISDKFGYDIRSIHAGLLGGSQPFSQLIKIEVKASGRPSLSNFEFKLSKNEWTTAQQDYSAYYIYCWAAVNLHDSASANGPYIIPSADLSSLVPIDQSEAAEWTECRIKVDLAKYGMAST